MPLSLSEKLQYCTVRIEADDGTGQISAGTGFGFHFMIDDTSQIPVIITNKHVVEGNSIGRLVFCYRDASGEPIDTRHFTYIVNNFENQWRMHPDPNVDLCALPIASVLADKERAGQPLFFRAFTEDKIPTVEVISDLKAIEDIIMIGYPNGLWDRVNNKPLMRSGLTATNPKLDWNGKKEFMIDAACFPGSSGSPVLIYNDGFYSTASGQFMANRIVLLGVLFAGPQHTATGEIRIVNIATTNTPIAVTTIPNNLGVIIKAERIMELKQLFI